MSAERRVLAQADVPEPLDERRMLVGNGRGHSHDRMTASLDPATKTRHSESGQLLQSRFAPLPRLFEPAR